MGAQTLQMSFEVFLPNLQEDAWENRIVKESKFDYPLEATWLGKM